MFTVYVDDILLYSTGLEDEQHVILSPKLTLDANSAGSFSFILPPGNALYDGIQKLKSIITVVQDGEIIFRGRVMDDEKDFDNQKDVYCEGDRSFLLDSLCAPYAYSGTVKGLFQKLISDHNEQVDAEKQFAIGNVTAVSSETLEVENVVYWDTLKEIDEKLLSAYGGYLKTRMDGDTCYIDWLERAGDTNGQTIEFSVNLLDLKDKVDAADVFTILIPLGASEIGDDGNYSDPVNIASVNGGKKYIQDDEAVALYGKIWRTRTWANEDNPAKLLEKGREYMKTGIAVQTLTINAVDMHFADSNAEAIRVGDYVRIVSDPHGLDITPICSKLEIELENPENATYTFGEPPKTLTENYIKTEESLGGLTGGGGGGGGGGGKSIQEELKDYIRWADIRADEDEATIDLLTGEVSNHGERLSKAEINLDGVNAQIVLKASVEEVNALGSRVSSAEIEIDGLNSEIILKADKVYVDAEVTKVRTLIAEEIEAVYSDVNYSIAESVSTGSLTTSGNAWVGGTMTASSTSTGSLKLNGNGISMKEATFLTSSTTLTVNATGGTVTGVTLNKKTSTIYYLDWN